ncbi:ABC transporter permease [Georgenia thermotolerans]|uniref:ABC transporter permease subunit n=1 Tax=Georgenia thermotolerans TaxID=527326 RepID=A0A7J5UTF5_9MICO|nr:ABC transporter permease [Georgenia thermotolerans]KAE8765561.1 ABC transporter permease subunit [Georgenia thermotolerans]
MRAAVTVAGVELRRFLRDRSNIFFAFVFPLLLVVLIGSQFGAGAMQGRAAVAGADTPLRGALVAALEDDDVAVTLAAPGDVREQLARGRTDVGILVPDAAAAAYDAGEPAQLEVIGGSQADAQATVQRVRTAVQALTTEQAQVGALVAAGIAADDARAALADAAAAVDAPEVRVTDVDEVAQAFSGLGQFDLGAATMTLLFVFLTSLTGSATLIQARRFGVVSRVLSGPVSTGQLIAGQALGRWVIAFFQGAYVMAGSSLLFSVSWGSIPLSLLLLAVFSVVSAAAGMVIGSVMDNDGAASGIGVGAGLILAALGGCMVPLEVFPDTLRAVSNVTPHAWAYEAFAQIQRHEGTLVDVLPQLGVLAAMAAVLLVLGAWLLRRSLARAL